MTNDMSDILEHHLKQVVKVKVHKLKSHCGSKRTGYRSFKLDLQTASYSYLRNLLAHIFHINGEFVISYRKDKDEHVPLTSDWDLDAAISVASKPYLLLTIELQPVDKAFAEWDIICPADIPPLEPENTRCSFDRRSLTEAFMDKMEHTILKIQRALSFEYHEEEPEKPPMVLFEFDNFLDSDGRLVNHREFHMSVYQGGVEPSIRPTVWKHLLNVFPHGMTLVEREGYLNSKSEEYYRLRYRWQHLIQAGTVPDVLADITSLVRKDVRRTDRGEKFYSGSDDNRNVRALFNILTTYAVNHPNVSYCQGMSDLLSPILYVMQKESHAYICFCGLMRRTRFNFKLDGKSMKLKFKHMRRMIHYYDHDLYDYLKKEEALDLLFSYRWLLLELKREFAYNDMLRVVEVIWGSLPPKPPQKELFLFDVKFPTVSIWNSLKERTNSEALTWRDDHFRMSHDAGSYTNSMTTKATAQTLKRWAIRVRRESIARHIESSSEEEIKMPVHYRKRKYRSYIAGKLGRLNEQVVSKELDIKSCKNIKQNAECQHLEICQSWSCGEVFEHRPAEINHALYDAREFLRNQWCYSNTINEIQLNNWLNGRHFKEIKDATIVEGDQRDDDLASEISNRQRHGSSDSNYSTIPDDFSDMEEDVLTEDYPSNHRSRSEGYNSDTASSSRESTVVDDYDTEDEDYDQSSEEDSEDSDDEQYVEDATNFGKKNHMLPSPHVLGDGNPFLLFLCIAMIEQHRDEILRKKFDCNELGIYFDRLVRKHKLQKILLKAQKMFKDYLNMGWDMDDQDDVSDEADF